MNWPEIILAVSGVVFAIALIPTLLSPGKPYPLTSVLTSVMLWGIVAAYVELGLKWPAAVTSVNAVIWMVLAYQATEDGVEGTS